jgi:hypothetical protein
VLFDVFPSGADPADGELLVLELGEDLAELLFAVGDVAECFLWRRNGRRHDQAPSQTGIGKTKTKTKKKKKKKKKKRTKEK